MRMIVPIGKSVWEFPTFAYLPQYLLFFVIGTVAYRHNWFRTMPTSMGIVGLATTVLAGVVLYPLAFSGNLFSLELTPALENAWGNGRWQSAAYALFDALFSVGTCLGAITLFRRFFNRESRFGKFLAQQSYAVYLIHIPIIVFLAYLLREMKLGNLAKFGIASLIIVPVCFIAAYLLRKIPLVARVL
jgi:peptidoglycan/LPS O-acetylase OafA/YrhL